MSIIDVTARIGQIQAQLAALVPAPSGISAASTSGATSATSGTEFADALQRAGGTTATNAAGGAGGSTKGEEVVAEAKKYLGVPYVWGGTDPDKGLDCSGLVQLVYRNLGHDLPRVSYQQATAGTAVSSLAQAKPGDILAFKSPVNHVAIYLGNNQMIEAPRPGKSVQISPVYETPTAIRRIVNEAPASSVSAASSASGSSRVSASTPYSALFNAAAAKYGVDATLLAAVAKQESGYNPTAVSPAGARGLMQLMPATAAGLGVRNSFDPAQAVDGAARLLDTLIDRFGRTDLALAAYNAGPGAVIRYDGIPPYAETQNYVRSVLAMVRQS
ncbi:transglycosylase SLT domain-containing protein [Nocardioides pacificus]